MIKNNRFYFVIPELLDSDRLNSLYITWLRLKIYWSLKFVDIFTCFFLIQILLAKGWYTIANFSHNWAIYKNGPPGRYFIKSTVAQMGHNFKKKLNSTVAQMGHNIIFLSKIKFYFFLILFFFIYFFFIFQKLFLTLKKNFFNSFKNFFKTFLITFSQLFKNFWNC